VKNVAVTWLKRVGQIVGVVALLAGAWAGYLRVSGNFHAIDEGVIYRSGQLSGSQFSEEIRKYGIKTILNLRGNNIGRSWYDDEIKASNAARIRHIDYPISSGTDLTDNQVAELTDILRTAPRPILIHCEAGSDRTGLISALYKLLVARRPVEESSRQLSFRYGHFPWLGSQTVAMDRTFDRVASKLNKSNGAH
jgi:protein tyrosine/serine phosphatase